MDKNDNLLEIAFKKLKSDVFFDKTQAILRQKIVDFEMSADFEETMEEVNQCLIAADRSYDKDRALPSVFERILSKINVAVYPKSIRSSTTDDHNEVITNIVGETTKVDRLQYFIDMPVMGYILGTLWVMLVGRFIDKDFYDKSYGNRIKEMKNPDDIQSFSPYLFRPYFEQYESWRDNALKCAQNLLKEKKNAVLITLDFKSFYYSVNVDRSSYFELFHCQSSKWTDNHGVRELLHKFVWRVMDHYSNQLRQLDPDLIGSRCVLPIGFMPSSILANYVLKQFDATVIEGWNPVYYGRYVDDLIFVDKVEKDSWIYVDAKEGKLKQDRILEHYFVNCSVWNRKACQKEGLLIDEQKKQTTVRAKENKESKENGAEEKSSDEAKTYRVNPQFIVFPKCDIRLQSDKVKVFYMSSDGADALFDGFRRTIETNSSEFRYLPEDEIDFERDDFAELYQIIKADNAGPNKIRDIKGLVLDKYGLSKFLGKYLRICGLVDDRREDSFARNLHKLFSPQVLIENYTTWEKVLEALIINENTQAYIGFIKMVRNAIEHTEVMMADLFSGMSITVIMQNTLSEVLKANIARTLALLWGEKQQSIIKDLNNLYDHPALGEECRKYCLTRMVDKYALPLLIDGLIKKEILWNKSSKNINLTKFSDYRDLYDYSTVDEDRPYRFYPFLVTVADLAIIDYINAYCKGGARADLNKIWLFFLRCNYDSKSEKTEWITHPTDCDDPIIRVWDESGPIKKLRVAVANVETDPNFFVNEMAGKFDRSYARYRTLVRIVNEAIKEKANMLILPEAYVPLEWVPIIARTCAKNGVALVTGIEECILPKRLGQAKRDVVNLTAVILPYKDDKNKLAITWFHRKKHFAPLERQIVESYGFQPLLGEENELFCWNNFWFSVYCCYELVSIKDRAKYMSIVDAIIAVEFNKDTNYYKNIVGSLSRDLHCYCIQVNTAPYGDTRITQPSKTETQDIINVKGGKNPTILVDEIDIEKLRYFQISGNVLQEKDGTYRMTPPDWDNEIVRAKIKGNLTIPMIEEKLKKKS